MRRFPLYLAISLATFGLGIIITTVWVIPHFRQPAKVAAPNTAQGPGASASMINCSGEKPFQREVESHINKGDKSVWEWSETRVGGQEDLAALQFVNADEGWVGGDLATLYHTTDAGRTWQQIKIEAPPDSIINSMSFVNPQAGWIVLSETGDVFNDIQSVTSRILSTTDGGKSWHEQYFDKALEIHRVEFVNEQEGWAIGSRIPSSVQYRSFIIHTVDGGKHWTDVTANLERADKEPSRFVVNLYAEQPDEALALKDNRKFYSTSDGGLTWREAAALPDEPDQSFLGARGFGVRGDNRMWAASGADSIEGMWGTVARMDSNCAWTKYTIGSVYFADAAFLSENEAIVCGTIPAPGHEEPRDKRDGLVLASADGGSNWTTVYRSPHTRLIALTTINSDNIWAAGDDGYLIHLQRKPVSGIQP